MWILSWKSQSPFLKTVCCLFIGNKWPWGAAPFPVKIDGIESLLMNIIMSPRIVNSAAILMSLHVKHQENTLFHFDCCQEGNANASIKKSLIWKPCPGHILKGHPKWHTPKICHLDMPWTQTENCYLLKYLSSSVHWKYILCITMRSFWKHFSSFCYRYILNFRFLPYPLNSPCLQYHRKFYGKICYSVDILVMDIVYLLLLACYLL